jgi:Mrp family chromosome partitioning ATPase
LNATSSVTEAIISSTGVTGLSVLPIKSVPENPADLLASGQMASVLKSLRETFEYIVIDSPPIIPFSDARSLALLSDAVILVSRYGFTTRRSITRAAEIISEMQVPLMGVVLNDMDLASADYHYFNYGYSWGLSGHRYGYPRKQVSPPHTPPPTQGPGPEKSRGAHA